MTGGGPGGPLPFRVYVDSGLVFLCIVALSPVCPLIAPFGFIYFWLFTPILRWLLIFVYRPDYDGGGLRWPLIHEMLISAMIVAQVLLCAMLSLKGGLRWPLIHEMLISAMIVAQVLLCAMLSLKGAFGPGVFALLSVVPTLIFNSAVKERFSKSYEDAGLLQTSQLDGWDTNTTENDREEFRSWLVDCHKASFVPVCIAGLDNCYTATPAVVLPDKRRNDTDTDDIDSDFMRNPYNSRIDSTIFQVRDEVLVPTLIFNSAVKERFSKSYEDAGLLQTSQLDGWDTNTTESDREEFRSWLVDCHKASFVPVCIAGLDNLNTAAPAVVLPDEKGVDTEDIESDLMPNLHLNQSQRGDISEESLHYAVKGI
eukprot:CAMPEP_0194196348 /NCGR_PEP_ID=MMETSP0154-20130528/76619_1 /TAXON_ID=1049557 /ORGANISM="Thalassiothrix antarctica, Strain L6-D1" /LENGTH=368 /DNA_ID=CAMNT_0038920935 /DNA_START=105 /DNA_END=1213 /DNA_ORIENTATION=+